MILVRFIVFFSLLFSCNIIDGEDRRFIIDVCPGDESEEKLKSIKEEGAMRLYHEDKRFMYLIRYGSKRARKLDNKTYQKVAQDGGNYNSNNELVGTNMSISAKAYEIYLGRIVTEEDMRNLDRDVALEIYYTNYFVKPNFNGLPFDSIFIDVLFNAYSNAPKKTFESLNYALSGCNIEFKTNLYFDEQTCNEIAELFNNDKFAKYEIYKKFYKKHKQFFKAASKNNARGLLKWFDDYPTPEEYAMLLGINENV